MLTIRLFRVGKKRQPTYKIVVTDKKNPPSAGRFVEEIGFYNPLTKERKINKERALYWISNGAQQSDTVYNFLITDKIIQGKKKPKHKIIKKEVNEQESQKNAINGQEKKEIISEKSDVVKEQQNKKQEIQKEQKQENDNKEGKEEVKEEAGEGMKEEKKEEGKEEVKENKEIKNEAIQVEAEEDTLKEKETEIEPELLEEKKD